MTFEESLQDVTIRERQLEAHILDSSEYLRRADKEIKRQVTILYLAIALLLVSQGLFTFTTAGEMPFAETMLISVTCLLAIVNCLLLIRSKKWLHRLNESWLNPQEKIALDTLRIQRTEILLRLPRHGDVEKNAGLN